MWPCLFWTSEEKCKRFGTGPKDVQFAESFSFVRLHCCVCYVTTMEAAAEEQLPNSCSFSLQMLQDWRRNWRVWTQFAT